MNYFLTSRRKLIGGKLNPIYINHKPAGVPKNNIQFVESIINFYVTLNVLVSIIKFHNTINLIIDSIRKYRKIVYVYDGILKNA